MRQTTNWPGVLFGVWLGVFAAFQQFKVPATLPLLLERYGYGHTLAGGFMSVYALAGLVLALKLGSLMQRHGGRRYIAGALVLFAAGSLATVAAPQSGLVVLAGRALEGVGFIILALACSALANLNASPRHLPVVAALVAAWIPVGQLLANAVAPVFVAAGQWKPVWWIGLALTLLTALWTLRLSRPASGIDLDLQVGTGASAGRGGVTDQSSTAEERRGLRIATVTFMLWSTQMFAFLTWTPQFLVDEYALSPAGAVLVYSLPVLLIFVGNLAGGAVLRSGVPLARLLTAVLLVQSVVWFYVPFATAGATGAVAMVAFGLAAGMTPTCLFAAPATILGTSRAGSRAFGLLHMGRSLGVLIGPLLMAQAFLWLGSWSATAPIFGSLGLLTAAMSAWLGVELNRMREPVRA